jgi:ADP-heptose:LPS heptosyltransferase
MDHRNALQDFSDTAALVQQMDLVIAVDTSVAHLAGAMGKPLWLLLPFIPDHRWMMDIPHSPWYPTARLFRQAAPGKWPETLAALRRELGEGQCRWGD